MAATIGAIIAALISGVCAVLVAKIDKDGTAERKKTEERAIRREKESRLSMELMFTTSELSDVIAIAVAGGHLNGNVEKARDKARKARADYEEFLRDEAAQQLAK